MMYFLPDPSYTALTTSASLSRLGSVRPPTRKFRLASTSKRPRAIMRPAPTASGAWFPCPEVTIDCAGDGDDQSLNSALEQLTYLALERHHPGWEINDGACGELVIDVATPSFVLDCQLPYTATDDHSTDL